MKDSGPAVSGIILKGIGGFYTVWTSQGNHTCKAKGIFRKLDIMPLPGDRVKIQTARDETSEGSIIEVLERKNCLTRPAVANIDQVALVLCPAEPPWDLLYADRILASAAARGIKTILIINKSDLAPGDSCETLKNTYIGAGYPVLLHGRNGEQHYFEPGRDVWDRYFQDRITTFAGQSGVGKSSLLNELVIGSKILTGSLSTRSGRGRHTTRHAELIPLSGGGWIVDTPGFSQLETEDMLASDLAGCYPELQGLTGCCRFHGCLHESEPDCAVKQAVREGRFERGRYERYLVQLGDIKERKRNAGYRK